MNRFAVLALCAPLIAAVPLACGETRTLAGGYAALDKHDPRAIQAKAMIQRTFADTRMRLGEIQEAQAQVVAGTNIKLVCNVTGDGEEPSVWEFVIWHKLDDSWRLTSAVRISPLI
jgi:hypothetical protein